MPEVPFDGSLPPTLDQPEPPVSATAPTTEPGNADTQATRDSTASGVTEAAPCVTASVPGYEILGELGRGGMGVVYKARHLVLKRLVALKMLSAGAQASTAQRARFLVEAEAAARLSHPNIVQIYEVGSHAGLPFFSLELVDGPSLAQGLAGNPWPARKAAALLETLARAMHYAHESGVVHRDLKPANVLLQSSVPKITDFGLAKQLDSASGQTQSGDVMGTPSYMAPEQARGQIELIGPRTDVYSLGAILYELLTGRPPFKGGSAWETIQQVLSQEPAPAASFRALPRDLATVCRKCLEKEPDRRYGSALELADDLRRFLDGEPIRARPAPAWEQLVKWGRRHPAAAALCLCIIIAVTALFVVSRIDNDRLARERDRAMEQEGLAQEARAEASRREQVARRLLYAARITLAQQAQERGDLRAVLDVLHSLRPEEGQADLRGFEWYYLLRQCCRDRVTLRGHIGQVTALAWSAGGTELASAAADGTVRLWRPGDRPACRLVLRGHTGHVGCLVWGPEDRTLISGGFDTTVRAWDAATGRAAHVLRGHSDWVEAVACAPDGKLVASAGRDRTVRLWDADSGRELAVLRGHAAAVTTLVFADDGRVLLSGSKDRGLGAWPLPDGKGGKVVPMAGAGEGAVFSQGGRLVAVGDAVWDVRGQKKLLSLGEASVVAFSADARTLALRERGAVHIWAPGGPPAVRVPGHGPPVSFAPDGKLVATGGGDGTVRLWATADLEEPARLYVHAHPVLAVAISRDGRALVSVGFEDGLLRCWDLATGKQRFARQTGSTCVFAVAVSTDGEAIATGGADGTVRLWSLADGQLRQEVPGFAAPVKALAFSSDGTTLAVGSGHPVRLTPSKEPAPEGKVAVRGDIYEPGIVRLWDLGAGREARTFTAHRGGLNALAFSPDDKLLATAGGDGARLWDWHSGMEVGSFRDPEHQEHGTALAPGRLLMSIQYRDTGKKQMGQVHALAFSPDGRLLVTGHDNRRARAWDITTGKQQFVLEGHAQAVQSVAFTPDGRTLATAGADGVRLWGPVGGQARATLPGNGTVALVFAPDGVSLFAGCFDGSVRRWRAASAEEADRAEARRRADALFARALPTEDVCSALKDDTALSETARSYALDYAQEHELDAIKLNNAAWSAIRLPGRSANDYALALRRARAACAADPTCAECRNTLGVALYRAGQYVEAMEVLRRSCEEKTATPAGKSALDLAFLAMTHHRLGQAEQTKALLAELRQLMRQPRWSRDEDARDLLAETEALLKE